MLERIYASLPSLSAAERRVAELVLQDPQRFALLPVSALAEQARVSKPTVVRCCRSLGFKGLIDFKLKLAGTVNDGVPYIHRSVDESDAVPELAFKVIDNTIAALLAYRKSLAGVALEQAVQALHRAHQSGRRIDCYGVGNSGIVAQDAQHKLFRLGVHTLSHCDGHLQVMSAALLGPDDVALIISNSGRTRDLLDAAQIARQRGATTVSITASNSPLALKTDIHLAADHSERFEQDIPMTSRLIHLLIIDILATGLALRIGSARLQPMLMDIKAQLHAKRYN